MPQSGAIDEIVAHRALESLHEAWVDLAHGNIAMEEAIERVRSQEPEALVERTVRMLTPPPAPQKAARLEALLAAHFPEPRLLVSRPAEPASAAPGRTGRSARWIYGVASALAAAAVVLLLVVPREPSPTEEAVAVARDVQLSLPPFGAGYELELTGALALERDVGAGAAGEVPSFRVNREVHWLMRPASRVSEAIGVRAFATRADGHAIALKIESETKPTGVVTLFGELRSWGLEPGRWTLTVVVGPPAGLPDALADVRMGDGAPYEVQQRIIEVLGEAAQDP